MFSLGKLFVLIVIVAVVWYGFKYLARLGQSAGRDEKPRGNARPAGDDASRNTVYDMETCRVCGTFVPTAAAMACGRDGCPYPP